MDFKILTNEVILMLVRKPILKIYGYVYLITNQLNNRKYIGIHHYTKPEIDKAYYGSGKIITQAVRTYGRKNFCIQVLDWAESFDELSELEKYYIKLYNAVESEDFYNLADGGHNLTSEEVKRFITESTRKTFSKNMKKRWESHDPSICRNLLGENNPFYGRHHTEETKQYLSQINTGRKHSEETKQKYSENRRGEKNPNYGNYWTDEQKARLSAKKKGTGVGKDNSNYGHRWSESQRASHYKSRPIVQLTLSGKFVAEYPYIANAARIFGVNEASIRGCCNGSQKTSCGYKWMYKENYYENKSGGKASE